MFSCTEASRCQPHPENEKHNATAVAHDAFNRLLLCLPQNTEALYEEAKQLINKQAGFLIVDDSTLDKPYYEKIDLVTYYWSGKHHRVVKGINLITLLGAMAKPTYQPIFAYTKLMVKPKTATFKSCSKQPTIEVLNPNMSFLKGWYSSLENLKLLRSFGYHFFCGLKENRLVNPTQGREGEVNLCTVEVSDQGLVVYLRGFGLIKIFRKVSKNGDVSFYGCNVLEVGEG